MKRPRIALTMGDPAGIGPELCLKILSDSRVRNLCHLVVIGDYAFLKSIAPRKSIFHNLIHSFSFVDLKNITHRINAGRISALAGRVSGDYIAKASQLAIDNKVDAIVTMPIHKKSFFLGEWGKKYPGHTEMLASLSKISEVALMLASGSLRAVHVTSHVALKEVPNLVSIKKIRTSIRLAHHGLKLMGIKNPKIGVSALNPHCGDNGLMGDEETRLISPAVRMEKKCGRNVTGPISSDVLWPLVLNKKFDVGIAMYHDQGQVAVKLHGFEMGSKKKMSPGGVNVTLGLPFIRTSPAHGAAYDIAGQGQASVRSSIEAVMCAIRMVEKRRDS